MIPVNSPLLDGNEAKYLQECINSGWISSEGPFVDRFEQEFSTVVGRRYGVACSNGSAALDLAVTAAGIGPGDEVILPTFTIISPAASIVRAGATPVLVDSDPVTWNMDVTQVEAKITPRTKAILVVHIYGLPVDMAPLMSIAERHGLLVIEDAAEMHGQTCYGEPCGSFGLISTFSFYPNKHITTGEGGMVVTNDRQIAERCRSLRNLCFLPGRRFVHEELGWNFRMTNLQAALGIAQLETLAPHITRKREIGRKYLAELSDLSGFQLPCEKTDFSESIYWVFGLVANSTVGTAADIMKQFAARDIGTRPFFWPMHLQPVFQRMGLFQDETYPVAERLGTHGFYLPSGLGLLDEQITEVSGALREVSGQIAIAN
jgi:perosamine synthetase